MRDERNGEKSRGSRCCLIPGGGVAPVPTSVLHGPLTQCNIPIPEFIIRLKLLAGTDSQLLHAILARFQEPDAKRLDGFLHSQDS